MEKVNVIEDEIADKDNQEEDKPVNTPDALKKAESAVTMAEKYKRDAYINSARNTVNRLIDSPEKTKLLERLDAIN